MSDPVEYVPSYASYNWTGAPADFTLSTNPEGGDSSTWSDNLTNSKVLKSLTFPFTTGVENLNKWFQSGDQSYIIVASAMVLVMIPGLGFLYSGLARRKSALS